MSWNIGLLENNLTISDECAKEINDLAANEDWPVDYEPVYQGQLRFDGDHQEHMDYVWDAKVQEVLLRHGCTGIVTFGSMEGDNAGELWGYQFADGKVTKLTGEITWFPSED